MAAAPGSWVGVEGAVEEAAEELVAGDVTGDDELAWREPPEAVSVLGLGLGLECTLPATKTPAPTEASTAAAAAAISQPRRGVC